MSTSNEIAAFLRETIADKAEIAADFSATAKFKSELDIDSLVMLEVIVDVEKRFGIKIPEERYGEFTCLDAATTMIAAATQKGAA